ncbi:MAG TPA: hypothetical protein VG841_00515 [Caulobacterales bacterium]|nr:hypothetical protein [Caulobacterales bacterium]
MRVVIVSALCAGLAALAGCASNSGQSVEEAARQACEAQHFQTSAELAECIDQTTANIQAARDLGTKPPERPGPGGGQSRGH